MWPQLSVFNVPNLLNTFLSNVCTRQHLAVNLFILCNSGFRSGVNKIRSVTQRGWVVNQRRFETTCGPHLGPIFNSVLPGLFDPWKIVPIGFFRKSCDYQFTLCNTPEERRSCLVRVRTVIIVMWRDGLRSSVGSRRIYDSQFLP